MEMEINYSEAFEQHPEIVGKWVKEGLKTKPKFNPEKAKWAYSFAQKIEGMRGDVFVKKLFAGELHKEHEAESKKTVEQLVEEQIKSVVGLSLTVNHAGFNREKSLSDLPKFFSEKFGALIRETEEKKLTEQKRLNKLSPEERDREANELINELHGMGGFVGFNVGPSGVSRIQPKKVTYSIDQILDKISKVGVKGLTDGEQKFLREHSKEKNK